MMLIVVAWRNIWRHPLRSRVIAAAIGLGLASGIFLMSFSWGMNEERVRRGIRNELSHIQIHHPKFHDEQETLLAIPGSTDIVRQLRNRADVQAVSGRVLVNGMAASASGAYGVQMTGIEPDDENDVTQLRSMLIEGHYFDGQVKNPLLIGKKLADKLKLRLRSKIVLTFQDEDHELISAAFRIVGVYRSVNGRLEERKVFVRSSDLVRHLSDENPLHEIAILIQQPDSIDTVAFSLQRQWPGTLVETWRELSPELRLVVDSFDQIMAIVISVLMLAMAFGIINTMLMAVLERFKELGMLMAVGMNRIRVFIMIVLETVFLSGMGALGGFAIGLLVVSYFGYVGIDISALGAEGLAEFGVTSMVYPKLALSHYLQIATIVVATSILASLYPAWKALRLQPAEAIRKI